MDNEKLEFHMSAILDDVEVDKRAFDSIDDAVEASVKSMDGLSSAAADATAIFDRLSKAAYGIKLDPDLESGLIAVQNKALSLRDAFSVLQKAGDRLTTSEGADFTWLDETGDMFKDIAEMSARAVSAFAEFGYTLDDVADGALKLGIAEREAGKIGEEESSALLARYKALAQGINTAMKEVSESAITSVETSAKQLPAVIQTSTNAIQPLVSAIDQMKTGFDSVISTSKQLPAVIDTVKQLPMVIDSTKVGTKELDQYITDTINKVGALMSRIDSAPQNMAGIDKVKNGFEQLQQELVDTVTQLQSGKIDISSAFVGLDDVNKRAEALKGSFNNFRGVIDVLKQNHAQYNAEVKQGLIEHINLEKEKESVTRKSANNTTKQGNEFSKAFNFGKIVVGLNYLKSAFNSFVQAIRKSVKTIVSFSKTMVSTFAKVTSTVTKAAVQLSSLPLIFKGIASAASGVKSAISGAFSGISFSGFIKESVELNSSLVEVENVINHVFGDEGKKIIDDFTADAVENLGMSTLAARQFAGKFGAALRTTGQSTKDINNMSKALTQLTSDIASFYDIEHDVAAQKLFSGVISGQIKPMRELGVDMTVASLKAYTLEQGYSKLYTQMSATEKQAVRFKYAMDKLSFAHGDYLRTIDSTANQIRLLKNQFKELGSIVGAIINAFFNPLLHVLNQIMAAAINVAKTIASVMGIDLNFSTGGGSGLVGLQEGFDDAADSAEGLEEAEDGVADGIEKAGKAAKKALAPFHKLNVLQNQQAESAGAGAGGSGTDVFSGIEASAKQGAFNVKDALKNLFDWLWGLDWEGALKKLTDAINKLVKELPDKIKALFEEIQKWVKRLSELFNQFIRDVDWAGVGNVIKEILLGLGQTILTALETIDFNAIGEALATMLNSIIADPTVFSTWGNVIGQAIQDGFDFIYGVVNTLDWEQLGEDLFEFIKGIFDKIDGDKIRETIFVALKGIGTSIKTFFVNIANDTKLQEDIANDLLSIFNGVADYLASDEFSELLDAIKSGLKGVLGKIGDNLADNETVSKIANGIVSAISAAGSIITSDEFQSIVTNVRDSLIEAFVNFWKDDEIPVSVKLGVTAGISNLTGVTEVVQAIITGLVAAKILGILGIVGQVGLAVAAIVAEYKILDELVYTITGEHSSWKNILISINNTAAVFAGLISGVVQLALQAVLELVKEILDTMSLWARDIPFIGEELSKAFSDSASGIGIMQSDVANFFTGLNADLATAKENFSNTWKSNEDSVKSATDSMKNATDSALNDTATSADGHLQILAGAAKVMASDVTKASSDVSTAVTDNLKKAEESSKSSLTNISNDAKTAGADVDTAFSTDDSGLIKIFQDSIEKANEWKNVITTASGETSTALSDGIKAASNDINTELDTLVAGTSEKITDNLKGETGNGIIGEALLSGLDTLPTNVTEALQPTIEAINQSISTIGAVEGEDSNAFLGIINSAENLATELTPIFDTMSTDISSKLSTLGAAESEGGNIFTGILTSADDLSTQLTEKFTTILETIKGEDLWGGLATWFTDTVWTPITTSLDELKLKIDEVFVDGLEDIKAGWSDLATAVSDAVSEMITGLNDAADAARNLADELAAAASAASSASSSSYSLSSRGYPSSIQGYAKGGVFKPNTPQLAILGDQRSGVNVESPLSVMQEAFRQVASEIVSAAGNNSSNQPVVANIYLGTELIDQEIITTGQMHNYRSNGR